MLQMRSQLLGLPVSKLRISILVVPHYHRFLLLYECAVRLFCVTLQYIPHWLYPATIPLHTIRVIWESYKSTTLGMSLIHLCSSLLTESSLQKKPFSAARPSCGADWEYHLCMSNFISLLMTKTVFLSSLVRSFRAYTTAGKGSLFERFAWPLMGITPS